jgi:hypothetical protein
MKKIRSKKSPETFPLKDAVIILLEMSVELLNVVLLVENGGHVLLPPHPLPLPPLPTARTVTGK